MVSHFAPTISSWDTCRILRRMVFRGTPVANCAACPTVEHLSQTAPTVFSWDTVRNLRQILDLYSRLAHASYNKYNNVLGKMRTKIQSYNSVYTKFGVL